MFWDNFERICKAKGTSPSSVAESVGVGYTTPSGWKKNGTIPKQAVLDKLSSHLGCHVADFFIDAPEPGNEEQEFFHSWEMEEVILHKWLNDDQITLVDIYASIPKPLDRKRFMIDVWEAAEKYGVSIPDEFGENQ